MIIYPTVAAVLLSMLLIFHCYMIINNQTTSESIRDKYSQWGQNPYDRGCCSKFNIKYFWQQQSSSIYQNKVSNTPKNQHEHDLEMVHSVEIDENYSVSQSHMEFKDDNKSVRSLKSFKSKGSIKSELHLAAKRNEVAEGNKKQSQTIQQNPHWTKQKYQDSDDLEDESDDKNSI